MPSGKTCPKANECLAYVVMNAKGKTELKDGENNIFRCYAASQENQYPNVYKARKYNFDLIKKTLDDDYAIPLKSIKLIQDSIKKHITKNIDKVRIHSSGDFFNGRYLSVWLAVARLNPLMKFYCYTKSLHLFGTNISIPKNFYVTASMGGLRDDLIHKGFFKRYAIVVNSEDSFKYLSTIINDQIKLINKSISSINMVDLSYESFLEKRFEDLAYYEPLYIKKPYVN